MAKDNTKHYDLKPIELQMLKVLQDQYYNTLSNYLSFVAIERLAYPVTANTKYEINDGRLSITEVEKPKEEVST